MSDTFELNPEIKTHEVKVFGPDTPRFSFFEEKDLLAAYEVCRKITRKGSKSFFFSMLFLPYRKRRAMWAVYTFCRYTDDLVDKADSVSQAELMAQLDAWENELLGTFQESSVNPTIPHMLAWKHASATFDIPLHPPLELIRGVRMDLAQNRYPTFEDLRLYCYRVASTVGLMASQVIGYSDPVALEYAEELGVAMQLTNILRDVGEDARSGRIYIPLDEMARFGYTEQELMQGVINENFINLMKFQIQRAREIYNRALPGIEYLDKDSRLAIATAAHLYGGILDVIERNGYDVFSRRAFVTTGEKIKGFFRIWRMRRKAHSRGN